MPPFHPMSLKTFILFPSSNRARARTRARAIAKPGQFGRSAAAAISCADDAAVPNRHFHHFPADLRPRCSRSGDLGLHKSFSWGTEGPKPLRTRPDGAAHTEECKEIHPDSGSATRLSLCGLALVDFAKPYQASADLAGCPSKPAVI
jgi:hypothetical protein